MKKIETIATRSIAFMVAMIMSFLTLMSFLQDSYFQTNYAEAVYYRTDNIINNFVFMTLVILLLFFAYRKKCIEKISEKSLILVLSVWVVVISGLWIYGTHSVPRADSWRVLNGIQEMSQGEYKTLQLGGYLQKYQNQIGITAFFEVIFRLLRNGAVDYRIIRVINIIMIVGIFIIMHLITKELVRDKETVILELLLSFGWFPLILYAVFVYGSIPGLFFGTLGIWLTLRYLKTEKIGYGIGLAVSFACAMIIKNNYMIYAMAAAIVLIINAISKKRKQNIIFVILMIVCFSVMSNGITGYYEKRADVEIAEGMPASAWIAMGMQEGPLAEGWYNYYNSEVWSSTGYDAVATNEIAKEYIRTRVKEFITNPKEAIRFYYKKAVSQWNEATYESLWITTHEYEDAYVEPGRIVKSIYVGKLHIVVEEIMNLYQLLIYSGTAFYAWSLCREKDMTHTILILSVLGGFLFHMLWEGKSQYIFPYVTLMLPCAAIGIVDLVKKFKKDY